MDKNRLAWVFPVFVFAIAAMAFVPYQLGFSCTYAGWLVGGGLWFAGLAVSAAFVSTWAAIPVALLSVLVLAADYGPSKSVGVPFLAMGVLFAMRGGWPKSVWWVRLVALVIIGWMGWAIRGWYVYGIVPAEERWGFIRFFSPEWPGDAGWPRLEWPMGNANPMAGILLMLLPLGVALTIHEAKAKLWRTPWAMATLVACGLLAASGSRAGLLAPVVAAAAYVALLPAARLRVRTKALLFVAGLAALVVFVAASPVYRERLFNPQSQAYSDEIRGDFLESGLAMASANPWTGVGAGGVPAHYGAYLSADADQPGCHQLHCTPVQWAAEFGVGGVLAWGLLAVLTLAALRRGACAEDERVLRGGAAVAAFGCLVYSLFDYQLYMPVTAFTWGACLGLAMRGWSWPAPSARLRPVIGGFMAVSAVVVAVVVVSGEVPRRHARDAARHLAAGRTAEALDALGAAMAADPGSPVYPAVAATMVATIPVTDSEAATRHRTMADALMAKACANAPDFPYLVSLRGWIWVDADPKRAEALFVEALAKAPKLADAWQGLARARGLQGRLDDAVTALALNGMLMPEDLFSPELRTGFFQGAAPRVNARFRELVAAYKREFPEDTRGISRLDTVVRQLDAWSAAGERVDRFVAQNPGWSDRPLWRHLASVDMRKNASGEYPLRSRMIFSAFLHSVLRVEAKDGHATQLLDQAAGLGAPFDGYRALRSRETFAAFGVALGDIHVALVPLRVASADLLALGYVYEGEPVRPHLAAAFFGRRFGF